MRRWYAVNYQLWKLLSSETMLGLLVMGLALLAGAAYAFVVWWRRKSSWLVNLAGVVVALYVGGLAWWHFMTLVDCGRPVPRLDASLRELQNDLNAEVAGGGKVVLCDNRLVLHVRVHGELERARQDALLGAVRERRQGNLKTTVVTYYGADGSELREEHF